MTGPIIALRAAILALLRADAALIARLGGPHVYEDVPRAAVSPFVTFGDVLARDWSTSTEGGTEQTLSLNIWSRQLSQRNALGMADRIAGLLQDARLTLPGHSLITMQLTQIESRFEDSGRWLCTSLRFRAVTEPDM